MKTNYRRCSGSTRIEATIAVVVLAAMFALLMAALSHSKRRSSRIGCHSYLGMIGLAFRQWGMDYNDKLPMEVSTNDGGAREWAQQGIAWPVFSVMSNEVPTARYLVCPNDSNAKRIAATTFGLRATQSSDYQVPFTNNQSLSYFVSLDASQTQTNLLLSGDSHFEMGGKELTEGLHRLSSSQKIG